MSHAGTKQLATYRTVARGLLAAFGVCAALGPFAAAQAAEISLRTAATCGSSLIRLEHIATIRAAHREESEALGSLPLFPAPAAGEHRLVRAAEIRELLTLRGIDLQRCRLTGASQVKVTAGAAVLPAVAVTAAKTPAARSTGERPRPAVSPATYNSRVPFPPQTAAKETADDAADERQVVVAARELRRGDVLRSDDVKLQPAGQRRWNAEWIEQTELAVGKELTRTVPANTPFESRALVAPVLVRKGETIDVVVNSGGIAVRTNAVALADGGAGETIHVQSLLDRKQQFLVRITEWKRAEVLSLASEATARPSAERSFIR